MSFRPPTPGALIENKYRLAERIGGGGMGDVYRADSLSAARPVAIKFLHQELAQNMEVAQRFFQEAQAVNRIRHPNVVDVLDAGVGEMGPYIVMEFLDGESVGSALTRAGRFDVDAAAGTAIPVLEALEAAHRVGVIHRDLKPENVFIAYDATRNIVVVRLLDFGIAKVLDASGPSPRTRTGVVFGTPDYLSPEQATGEGPLDGRSDLFAVGVLLYELVTGMRPFRAPTAVATAFKVVHAEAPSIAAAGVHVDARLEGIVHRLMQKEPSRRFPAAAEVIRELEKVSPDPARRMLALAKVVGVQRKLAVSGGQDQAGSSRDATPPPATRSSDPGTYAAGNAAYPTQTRRLGPEIAQLATQPGQRVLPREAELRTSSRPAPHTLGSSPAPRAPMADLPKTLRSPTPLAYTDPRSGPGHDGGLSREAELRTSSRSSHAPSHDGGLSREAELRTSSRSSHAPGHDGGLPREAELRAASRSAPHAPGVRPFPQRFAGKYQVRGPVLRSVDKVIIDLFGLEARDEVVAQMPEGYASDFRNDSINALVAYDLEALDAYMENASALLMRDPGRWREIGRLAVDGELHNVVRTLLRPAADLGSVIRRGISTWARLFSFGAWRVGPASAHGKVMLSIGEFEAVPQPLRLWVVGVVEQTARRAVRAELRVTVTAGEQDFTPEICCEIG